MAWYDTVFDWVGKNSDDLINVGTGIYDIYNQQQTRNQLQDAIAPGGIVDPFGAQRPAYQQRLANLYSNPMSVQNTPGFQFAQQIGEQAVNRQASKSGHFHSPNRLQEIAKFNQGLATQTFNQERNSLMQLAGAGIDPNAGAYLKGMVGQQQLATGSGVSGGNVLGGGATGGGVFDLLSSFDDASGIADAASGGDGTTLSDRALDEVKSAIFGAEDAAQYAGTDLEVAVGMGGGELERAQALEDLGPNADLGGANMASLFSSNEMLSNSLASSRASDIAGSTQGSTQMGGYGSLSGASAAGAGIGGAIGGMALTKALGTEGNAAIATNTLGGVAGTTVGAGLGSMAMGGGFGAGAGAAGGAAAGGMAAGPMIPLALAMMAYGGYQEHQAETKARKEFAGQFAQHANIQDAAGGGKTFTDPRSGQSYYIDKNTYDMWYGGDMDRSSYLYDPTNTGYLTGVMDWQTGKIQSRDDIYQAQKQGNTQIGNRATPGGLTGAQADEMRSLWDERFKAADNPVNLQEQVFGESWRGAGSSGGGTVGYNPDASTPYQYVHGNRGGDAGTLDPGVWVNTSDGSLANQATMPGRHRGDGEEGHWTMGGQTFDMQTGQRIDYTKFDNAP